MGIGDAQHLQHALDRAILAARPMQGVEGDVGLQGRELRGYVSADIDLGDAIADAFQRPGAGLARSAATPAAPTPTRPSAPRRVWSLI